MAFKDHLKQAATAVEEPPTMENTVPLVQENITYYHWAGRDAKGRAYPSSEIIHVSGGESRVTTDGQKVIMPEEHIDFHNGMYTTNDPNKIKVLERFCANPGNCVTRDPGGLLRRRHAARREIEAQGPLGRDPDRRERAVAATE